MSFSSGVQITGLFGKLISRMLSNTRQMMERKIEKLTFVVGEVSH
jgi:hypothetical protein